MNATQKCPAITGVVGWATLSTLALMMAKQLSPVIPSVLLVFIRSLFGILLLAPFALGHGLQLPKKNDILLHLARIMFSFASMVCTYYAYRQLPLAFATSIGFTAPMITSVLAMLFLGSIVTRHKWFAIFLGYLGVLVMLQPQNASLSFGPATLILLLSNLCAGITIVIMKQLSGSHDRISLLFYSTAGIACASGVASYQDFIMPGTNDLWLIFGIGILMTAAQFCYLSALRCSDPVFIAPFEYSKIVIAIPLGFVFFKELPGFYSYLGSAIIIASNYLITIADKQPHESIEEQQ